MKFCAGIVVSMIDVYGDSLYVQGKYCPIQCLLKVCLAWERMRMKLRSDHCLSIYQVTIIPAVENRHILCDGSSKYAWLGGEARGSPGKIYCQSKNLKDVVDSNVAHA
jgi:hypothetical protein